MDTSSPVIPTEQKQQPRNYNIQETCPNVHGKVRGVNVICITFYNHPTNVPNVSIYATLLAKKLCDSSFLGQNLDLIHSHFKTDRVMSFICSLFIFKYNCDVLSSCPTRQSDLMFIERCDSTFSARLPLYNFPNIYNKWSRSLSLPTFKSRLQSRMRTHLLSLYPDIVNCSSKLCKQCQAHRQ